MIVVRAPFRIPLGGGGTDLPSYYSKFGGELVSAAIDKYMYVCINRPALDKSIRLKYSLSEQVESVDKLQNEYAREALKLVGVDEQVEIDSIADLAGGSGMGSSGSYLVALLKGLHTFKNQSLSTQELAEEACKIEIDILKKPVGKQDQYMAAFGGITHLVINKKGQVEVNRLAASAEKLSYLEHSLVLFYTGMTRSAGEILRHQSRAITKNKTETVENMHRIKEIGREIVKAIKEGDVEKFGTLMDFHWQSKRGLSSAITNTEIDTWYQKARLAGAIGGKLVGAGGGGFLLFCCPGDKHKLREAMRKESLTEMFFHFDMEGAKVLADFK